MKKYLLCLSLLLVPCISVFAQSWKSIKTEGDELIGNDDHESYIFTDGQYSFIYWSNKDDYFRIYTDNKFFDTETKRGANGEHVFVALVGFYDENNNLIEKNDKFCMEVDGGGKSNSAHPNKYTLMGGNNKKTSKKILNYLESSKGYVRFVCNLYGTGERFDLKVKCRE